VEKPCLAGNALNKDSGLAVDQDGHLVSPLGFSW
jgi:hypothetical protein